MAFSHLWLCRTPGLYLGQIISTLPYCRHDLPVAAGVEVAVFAEDPDPPPVIGHHRVPDRGV